MPPQINKAQPPTRREGGVRLKDGLRAGDGGSRNRLTGQPLVSIITAVFNGGDALEATIRSVMSQSSGCFEYLIVDGGSIDNTVAILQENDDGLDYWVSEPDDGIYDAFNKGVKLATGKWVLFLGAGDALFDSASMCDVAERLETAKSEVQVAYGRVVILNKDGSFVEEENEPWISISSKWKGGRKTMPHHQGILQRREFLLTHPFDLKYKIVADYKVFMSAVSICPPLYIDRTIAKVYLGGVSSAPHKAFPGAIEIIRLNRELGSGMDHVPHQMFFAMKSAVKSLLSVVLPVNVATRFIDIYRRATGRRKKWT
jgi:glycosyltransferase involved in cell wall biosynthesis